MKTNKALLFLVISIGLLLFVPLIFQPGMFFDGITYSAIARNLSLGLGSFWQPHYTQSIYPVFYEHPPLVFGIQSIFFSVFGDGFMVEKVYSLLCALAMGVGIVKFWKLNHKNASRYQAWLPLSFWIVTPIVIWCYRNNMLENTMAVFTLFSSYFIVKSIKKSNLYLLIPAALLMLLGTLSKGPVALFPLAIPFIYVLAFDDFSIKKSFITFILFAFNSICFFAACFLLLPESYDNIIAYLNQQVIPALNNKREITTSFRLKIIVDLIMELALPLLIVLGMILYSKFKKRKLPFKNKSAFLFFLMLGIAASFPLIVSLKQRTFYLLPAVPFYSLAFGFLLEEGINKFIMKKSEKWVKSINFLSVLIIVTVVFLSIFNYGKPHRDVQLIEDIAKLQTVLPEATVIQSDESICYDWTLIAYLAREASWSIDCKSEHKYLLANKSSTITDQKYEEVEIGMKKYKLYHNKMK